MDKKLTPRYLDKHLKIGADPEFLLITKSGGSAYGNEIIRDGHHSSFGVDGAGTALEIRPSPNASPKMVVASIQRAMRRGLKKFPRTLEFQWKAGGDKAHPIGGHIHFGTAYLDLDSDTEDIESDISDAMDHFLAVPVLAIEEKSAASYRRGQTGYGKLGDIREQDHGCEYRSLGSWLTSPEISLAVLSLAKVVAVESLSGRLKSSDMYSIPHTAFNNAKLSPAITAKAWSRIEKMALYPKYKRAIKIIRTLTKEGKTWDAGDMKASWGLITPRMIAKLAKIASPLLAETLKLSKIWHAHRASLYTVSVS